MNWRPVALAGLLPLAGCTTLFQQAAHNLAYETHLFHGEAHVRQRMRKDAEAALTAACERHSKKAFSAEFRDGFLDGYVDYLDVGGPAQPPAVAPARYRKPKYLSPDGQARVRDYLLGFGYGATVAEATGRRAYYLVPVRAADPPPPAVPNITVLPPPPDGLSTDDRPMPPPDPPAKPDPAGLKPDAPPPT